MEKKLIPKNINGQQLKIAITEGNKILSKSKKVLNNIFKSELDWSPESWFGKRPKNIGYTLEEIKALQKHIPEYLKIEKEAKKNGTWLTLPNGLIWEGDPREWVMMLSRNYKKFIKDSKLKDNYTHESNNWDGVEIKPHSAISGKLFGNGFYLFHNPTGKDTTIGKIYTLQINNLNKPTAYNIAINSKTPAEYDSDKDLLANIFISDRNSPARVGSFHYPLYSVYNDFDFDPRLNNDVLILDKAWKGKDKIITGFPGEFSSPIIKFITGNTGEFSTSKKLKRNVFRGLTLPIIPYFIYDNNK